MEYTLENKANFFALYWMQKVMKARITNPLSYHKFTSLMNVDINEDTLKENWFLELTPLSQITDEHKIELAKVFLNNSSMVSEIKLLQIGNEIISDLNFDIGVGSICWSKIIKIIDFLRSKSYYIGDGTEISFGWVKLKEG